MSASRRRLVLVVAAVVLVGAATIAAIVPRAVARRPVHEIRLVVRQMAYYAEGSSTPNPTLTVRRGDQVRIVLRNDDAGMIHDFAVRDWDAATRRLAAGEEAVITFTAPEGPGLVAYSCTPHGEMMRGTIRVE